MIIENETDNMEDLWCFDTGRPTFFDDEARLKWCEFFEYVESTDIPIKINGAYHGVREMAFDPEGRYGGSGFAFCFFFENKEDRKQFLAKVTEIFGKFNPDWRNLMFYDLEGKGGYPPNESMPLLQPGPGLSIYRKSYQPAVDDWLSANPDMHQTEWRVYGPVMKIFELMKYLQDYYVENIKEYKDQQ